MNFTKVHFSFLEKVTLFTFKFNLHKPKNKMKSTPPPPPPGENPTVKSTMGLAPRWSKTGGGAGSVSQSPSGELYYSHNVKPQVDGAVLTHCR